MSATMLRYAAAMLSTLRGVDVWANDAIACECLASMDEREIRIADNFIRACHAGGGK